MNSIKVAMFLLPLFAATAGCAGFQQRIARYDEDVSSKACMAAGYTMIHPQYEECVANTTAQRRRQGQIEAQNDILGAVVVGAALNGASSAPVPAGNSTRAAPLVDQKADGWQRFCIYHTPTGNVQMTLSLGQSCPPAISY